MTKHKKSALERLQDWYIAKIDGDWEHQGGIKIGTLDNPGWDIEIEFDDWEGHGFDQNIAQYNVETSEEDFILFYAHSESNYSIFCSPQNLEKAVNMFLDIDRTMDDIEPENS